MKWLGVILGLAYPFLVLAALQWWEPRWIAVGVATAFVLRGVLRGGLPPLESLKPLVPPVLLVATVIGGTIVWNDERVLLFLPVAINVALLLAFGRTVFGGGPSMIESFARLQDPHLTPAQIAHCRLFTILWCFGFALSAWISGVLAWNGQVWAWTWFTGFGAYLGMGLLFAAEFLVRAWRFGRYGGSAFEPLLRRFFPSRDFSAPDSESETGS